MMKKLFFCFSLCFVISLSACQKPEAENKVESEATTYTIGDHYKIAEENAITLANGTKLSRVEYDYEKAGIEFSDLDRFIGYTYVLENNCPLLVYMFETCIYIREWDHLNPEKQKAIMADLQDQFFDYKIEPYLEKAYTSLSSSDSFTGAVLTILCEINEVKDGTISVAETISYNAGPTKSELEELSALYHQLSEVMENSELTNEEKEESFPDFQEILDAICEIEEKVDEKSEIVSSAELIYDSKTGARIK